MAEKPYAAVLRKEGASYICIIRQGGSDVDIYESTRLGVFRTVEDAMSRPADESSIAIIFNDDDLSDSGLQVMFLARAMWNPARYPVMVLFTDKEMQRELERRIDAIHK